MRIIGGSAKRRSLKSPSSAQGVRPILGRIKKSLFDILTLRLQGAVFLDLYAGSGAVGIEALSRGVASVTFADRNPNCLSIIRQNLSTLKLYDRARLVRADATRDLGVLGGPFDLIFMGPPYHDEKWNALTLTQPTLAAIHRAKLLKPEGWVIGQHHAKEPEVTAPEWTLFRQEEYGDTRLSFFVPAESSEAAS
jgi:16S rRNA (guanine966-N2)-methyltransferase